MSEMVSRIHDVIEKELFGEDPAEDLYVVARAVIAAMREPTDAMVAAANRNNHPRDIDTWQTMIDEALKD